MGAIDEIKLYDIVLTPAQIQALAARGATHASGSQTRFIAFGVPSPVPAAARGPWIS